MFRWMQPLSAGSFALAALLLASAAGMLRAQQPPGDKLEAYLLRLGLSDLRVRRLERIAENETDEQARLAAGIKLADAYAERLMAVAEDESAFQAIKGRVDKLLARLPQAKTPSLTVMLLQADFQRAESLINAWLDGAAEAPPMPPTELPDLSALPASQAPPPPEAVQTLTRIVPELVRLVKQLNAAAEKVLVGADELSSEEGRQEAEQESLRLQAVAARATYFAGWGHYYLGLTKTNDTARGDFQSAKQFFLDVLGITDEKDYQPVEVEGLGLESIWRARTAIGLGLAETALGRTEAAATCFRWLEHASAPANLRDEAVFWQLKGLLNVRKFDAAAALAELKVETFSSPPTPGKNSFCIALIRTGASQIRSPMLGTKTAVRKLLLAGIGGLARLRQFDTLGQLVSKYNLQELPEARDSFYLVWLSGRQQFLAAEKTKERVDYEAAASTLERALTRPDSRQDLYAAGQCRYYLAWSYFRLEELEAAAKSFHEVTPVLREGEQELAVQANWMEFAAWQALAQKRNEPRFATSAIAALNALKRDFPGSEQAAKADIYIARLQQNVSPDEAIASLARVKPDEANYQAAQFEIVSLRYQLWKKAAADETARERRGGELLASIDGFLSAAGESGWEDERLRACLMAVEVLSADAQQQPEKIDRYLNHAKSAAETLAASHPLLPEYHYRRLQHAQRTKDDAQLREEAEWLVTHGAGTPYELPALVLAARQADQAADAASASDRRARQEQAAEIYRRLASAVGDSPEAIAGAKNALAANSRLAAYDEALGRWKEAAARLDKIVAAFPSDKKYLRRAGLAHVNAGNHVAAGIHWRKLLSGLRGGSDEWLEAKYYQLTCLLATDRPAAEKVFRQFKLLYPEVESAAWQEKFTALESQFAGK